MQENSIPGKVSKFVIFTRLTRAQFLPLILLPASVGTGIAYSYHHAFNPIYFGLTLLGVGLLHLGANAIDDCYDYQNGVDGIANSMFPKDFGGWKPIPRGLISLRNSKAVSYSLLAASLALAAYFSLAVGIWSLILGITGVLLAIFYTAPPFKLDYRGYGLGEIAIFFAFGPIPVLGSFYVQTGELILPVFLVSLAVGLVTVTILIDHDLIFYEVYRASKKLSLGTILGRARALSISLGLTILAYLIVLLLVVLRILPVWSVAAPLLSALVLQRKANVFRTPDEPPPYYVSFTANALFADWIFVLTLAVTISLAGY